MEDRSRNLVSVCVCTRRRPEGLQRLVSSLGQQILLDGMRMEVVVVENDAMPTCEGIVAAAAQQFPGVRFTYRLNRVQNIALSRNEAVKASAGTWIAFIDDDEAPERGWLMELVAAALASDCDGAFGPVLPEYPPGTSLWVRSSPLFRKQRDGNRPFLCASDCRTSNALVRRAALLRIEGPFDVAFGLSGGEDYLLFAQLIRAGSRFVWAEDARVVEFLGPERVTLGACMRRAFAGGTNYVRVRQRLGDRLARLRCLARGAAGSLLGLLFGVLLLPFRRSASFRWFLKAMAGFGKCNAVLGRHYAMYADS